jgi:glycosyltransferase involved in cell wall biosynthesis
MTALPEAPAGTEALTWPKITMVTAVYNGEHYLEDTIRSILLQGYPNLEYIIVNDGSTDETVDIIRKYEDYLAGWIDQPNKGMYAALNAGFARASGEILGWLNASDKLHTSGLFVVGSVFATLPQVEWITARPTGFNQTGMTVLSYPLQRWSRFRFLAGANKYIQQESTFWRRSLWNRAGGSLGTSYGAAGDFELWTRFFRHAALHTVDALIGGYRFHEDAQSWAGREKYDRACDEIVAHELDTMPGATALKALGWIDRTVKPIPKVRGFWQRIVMKGLYRLPGPDLPPLIQYQTNKWVLRKK